MSRTECQISYDLYALFLFAYHPLSRYTRDMTLFNQYSAVLTIVFVGLIPIGLFVRRAAPKRRLSALIGGVALLVGAIFILLRPQPNSASAADVAQLLAGNGRPVLIQLYSDY